MQIKLLQNKVVNKNCSLESRFLRTPVIGVRRKANRKVVSTVGEKSISYDAVREQFLVSRKALLQLQHNNQQLKISDTAI